MVQKSYFSSAKTFLLRFLIYFLLKIYTFYCVFGNLHTVKCHLSES